MARWEPLAERVPVDARRLATQLRRMKDRSGLTVPALAARTAQPAEVWERALAGRQLPPLDAVEVLAQASGADYERIAALWRLAQKSAEATGDRGRGRPVPDPDPLDPLGPDEGLPHRSRRVLALALVGLLAAGALVAVLVTAGSGADRNPAGSAVPTDTGSPGSATHSPGGAGPGTGSPGQDPPDAPSTYAPRTNGAELPLSRTTTTASPTGSTPPGSPSGGGSSAPPPATGTGAGTGSAPPTAPPSAHSTSNPSSTAPTPTPTSSGICIGVIVLGICIR